MPLTGRQIAELADRCSDELTLEELTLLAQDMDINLSNMAPGGSVKERAQKLISHMNSALPPRDRELLERLRARNNARLRTIATELLKPTFLSPTGDAHDAIVLGRTAFVDRSDLRELLREFTNPSPYTTHVLIVRGDEPCGKSYSWEFLRHLAVNSVGAYPQRLRLKDTRYKPSELLRQIALLLNLDASELPEMTDDPQLALIDPLINWFAGAVITLQQPYWLVVDDLNDPSVTPDMLETAYALAYCVEQIKPQKFWIALIGYNAPVTDSDLRHIAQEDARFPDVHSVAEHFREIAKVSPKPLSPAKAREIANLLYTKFPRLNKDAMAKLTLLMETMGEKLRQGQQP